MKYTYKDFPDKSIKGIKKQVAKGSLEIGSFLYQSFGLPYDIFCDKWNQVNLSQQLQTYMNFKNGRI